MDIDTNWCIYCNKQTNGSLYCSSQCRIKDEKQSNMGINYEETSDSMTCKYCPSESSNSSCSNNNYLKHFFYKGNDLKFRNRPTFDTGYYGRKGNNSMQKPWVERDNSCIPTMGCRRHHIYSNGSSRIGYGHNITFSSSLNSDSDDSISTTSTMVNPLSKYGHGKLRTIKDTYYPYLNGGCCSSSSDDDYDDDISLYEY